MPPMLTTRSGEERLTTTFKKLLRAKELMGDETAYPRFYNPQRLELLAVTYQRLSWMYRKYVRAGVPWLCCALERCVHFTVWFDVDVLCGVLMLGIGQSIEVGYRPWLLSHCCGAGAAGWQGTSHTLLVHVDTFVLILCCATFLSVNRVMLCVPCWCVMLCALLVCRSLRRWDILPAPPLLRVTCISAHC